MSKWGVVIVLYNPDLPRLKSTLDILSEQTGNIVLVNNGLPLPETFEYSCFTVELGENRGIAFAQNRGVEHLMAQYPDLQKIFFLDQDSAVDATFFNKMLQSWENNLESIPNLGLLSPVIKRRKETGVYSVLVFSGDKLRKIANDFNQSPLLLQTLPISSGILVSVEAFTRVGGLSEKWFIDWVDFDFALKLLGEGFMTATTSDAAIVHEIGTPVRRSFFGKKIAVTNYVLFREYYTARNGVYLMRKYGRRGNGISKYCWGQIARRFLMLLYEPKKLQRFATLIKGLVDGILTAYA